MDQVAIGMEHFAAQIQDATTVSTAEVARADLFVLIIAWRYGFVPAGETRSVTHLEYEEALRLNLPILVFLAHPSTKGQTEATALFPLKTRDKGHRRQLSAFREIVSNGNRHTIDWFTNPDNLAATVTPALFRALRELPLRSRPPRDLPPRAPAFLGREQELYQLRTDLQRGQSIGLASLVTGMAGVGKSALAAQVVADIASQADSFPGGITWVRCDGRSGLDGLTWVYDQVLAAWESPLTPQQLAQAVQADSAEAGVDLRERALRKRLRPPENITAAPALLLLDNVERGLPLERALTTLTSLKVTCFLTARFVPSVAHLQVRKLDVLDSEAALQLFVERYREMDGHWDEAVDSESAMEVVKGLGYLPLAIELAAKRAGRNRQRVHELADEVNDADRLHKLRDPLDPTLSARYAFSQSVASITAMQRLLFATLGLVEGPTIPLSISRRLLAELSISMPRLDEAYQAPVSDPGTDLDILVALSLVSRESPSLTSTLDASLDVHQQESILRLHPLLRDFARELWADELAQTQRAGLTALVTSVRTFVDAHKHDFATLAHEEELINGAIALGNSYQIALADVDETINDLYPFLTTGGHWRLGIALLTHQLAYRREAIDKVGEGKTLSLLGRLANALGRRDEARSYYDQALTIQRAVGDRVGEASTLNDLGSLTDAIGRREEANVLYKMALSIRQEVHDRTGEGQTLNNLGSLANALGRRDEARSYYDQALTIQRAVGDRVGEGQTLSNLGYLLSALGQKDEAQKCYTQALEVQREVGDLAGEGATLHNLGCLEHVLDHVELATPYLEQALAIRQEVGERAGEAATLNELGRLAHALGNENEAHSYFERGLTIRREVHDRPGEGQSLNNLGCLARTMKLFSEAQSCFEQALAISREVGDQDAEATVLNNMELLARDLGRLEEA
jgi:tetratricopeptide (TPR) repeat protein